MSLVSNYNPEDNIPTRADIEAELDKININVKPKRDNPGQARLRNVQRTNQLRPILRNKGMTDKQIAKVLSDLSSYKGFEDEDVPHVMREM